jgi:GNAT superfamily N-acetyltransferase
VHPDFQRQGIASLLLQWGLYKADELHAKLWVASTPQAIKAYEKSGFEIVERHDVDLSKYGGEGIYSRAWMLRLPMK